MGQEREVHTILIVSENLNIRISFAIHDPTGPALHDIE
jgi:hypothetical protein